MPLLGRSAAVSSLAVLLVGVLAGPALAHGRGSDATNYLSQITATPDLPGLAWEIHNGDEFLSLENASDREVVVLGYADEPYLRIGPDGVFENRRSAAAYINADRYAAVDAPDSVDPLAPPEWVRVSGSSAHAWHDHRIHFMSPQPPRQVEADPSAVVEVFPDGWTVPFTVEGEPYEIAGTLTWVPATSPSPWLVGALAVTSVALVGLRTRPADGGRWPGLARPAAAVLGVVTLLNLTNLVDDLTASPVPIATQLLPAGQTLLFLAIAAFGAVKAWQGGDGAFTALGVGAGALLVGQGLLYLPALSSSQSASVFPQWVTRAAVAASIAQAVPLGIAAVVGTRRTLPPLDAEPTPVDASGAATA